MAVIRPLERSGVGAAVVLAITAAGAGAALTDDRLEVTPSGTDFVAVVAGVRGDKCETARVFAGTGSVAIGNFGAARPDCPPGVSVFAIGHGMLYEHPVEGWTDAAGDVLKLALPARIPVRLNVVVVSDPADVDVAHDDLERAEALFNENRAGFSLVASPRRPTAAASVFGDGCMALHAIRKLPPPDYEPAQLNVYYVSVVNTPVEDNLYGYHCESFGGPEVIFISLESHTTTTLAHELGHAFGLQVPDFGHANKGTGFDAGNVMWSELDVSDANARESFTLGQVFRMNVDGRSWVNYRPYPASTTSPRIGYVVDCQDTWTYGACPRLRTKWP